jgi:hypothetical protein
MGAAQQSMPQHTAWGMAAVVTATQKHIKSSDCITQNA